MRNILDYTYYRTAKRHFKNDGVDAFTAILALTFIVSLYTIPFLVFIYDLIKIDSSAIILYGLSFFIIGYFVRKNYKGKYLKLREKWVNESKMEKLIGEIYIVLFFLTPLAFIFLCQEIKKL